MRLVVGIPETHISKQVLEPAAEAVTRLNEQLIAKGEVPTFHDALSAGAVRWQPEPPGQEAFDHARTVLGRGWGDCDDLAPWRAASARATGEDPGARAVMVQKTPTLWHCVVQRSDGRIEDPSIEAGMHKRNGGGPVPPPATPIIQPAAVVGGVKRPHMSLRPVRVRHCVVGWQARIDMPTTQTEAALVQLHYAPVASQAIVGAACAIGELCDAAQTIVDPETIAPVEAIAGLLAGLSPREVAECCGTEAVRRAATWLDLAEQETHREQGEGLHARPSRRDEQPRALVAGVGAIHSRARHAIHSRRRRVSGGDGTDTLQPGESLQPGQRLVSQNGMFKLCMQGDGNLVELDQTDAPIWDSRTEGRPGGRLDMQGDGNAVIYTGSTPGWSSVTFNNPGAYLTIQNDGNAVVYASDGHALWSTQQNTYDRGTNALSSATHVLTAIGDVGKQVLSAVQGVISLVPVIGPGISAAISAGLAVLAGDGPLEIAIRTAYGAIPIPPGLRNLTDMALDGAMAIANAGNVTDAVIKAARDKVPGGLPQDVFDTLVHIILQHVQKQPTLAITTPKPGTPPGTPVHTTIGVPAPAPPPPPKAPVFVSPIMHMGTPTRMAPPPPQFISPIMRMGTPPPMKLTPPPLPGDFGGTADVRPAFMLGLPAQAKYITPAGIARN